MTNHILNEEYQRAETDKRTVKWMLFLVGGGGLCLLWEFYADQKIDEMDVGLMLLYMSVPLISAVFHSVRYIKYIVAKRERVVKTNSPKYGDVIYLKQAAVLIVLAVWIILFGVFSLVEQSSKSIAFGVGFGVFFSGYSRLKKIGK